MDGCCRGQQRRPCRGVLKGEEGSDASQDAQGFVQESCVFNVADFRKPLASAVKMVRAGNRLVFDEDGSHVESQSIGERIWVEVKDETFVFNITFENGKDRTITLDSGFGVNVWPSMPKYRAGTSQCSEGLKMCAANGTEIANFGRQVISFDWQVR